MSFRAHASTDGDDLRVWTADDPTDELAPNVLPDVVYQDEGRGAFPHLRRHHGSLDAAKLIEVADGGFPGLTGIDGGSVMMDYPQP